MKRSRSQSATASYQLRAGFRDPSSAARRVGCIGRRRAACRRIAFVRSASLMARVARYWRLPSFVHTTRRQCYDADWHVRPRRPPIAHRPSPIADRRGFGPGCCRRSLLVVMLRGLHWRDSGRAFRCRGCRILALPKRFSVDKRSCVVELTNDNSSKFSALPFG